MKKIRIDKLNLSGRALNVLKTLKIDDLYDVSLLAEHELMRNRNCGKKTLNEIKSVLGEYGLTPRIKKEVTKELKNWPRVQGFRPGIIEEKTEPEHFNSFNQVIESACDNKLHFDILSTRLFSNSEDKATLKMIGKKHGITYVAYSNMKRSSLKE